MMILALFLNIGIYFFKNNFLNSAGYGVSNSIKSPVTG